MPALGDRKAPFPATTALSVVEAARAAGLPVNDVAGEDAGLCARYPGCRSATAAGSVKIIVFESAAAAQDYRQTADGSVLETLGGRRYWLLVDYRELSTADRASWRDLQRDLIP